MVRSVRSGTSRSGRTVLSKSPSSASGRLTSRSRSHDRWHHDEPSCIGKLFGGKRKKTLSGYVGGTVREVAYATGVRKKPKTWSKWTQETATTVLNWTADWVPWAAKGIWDTLGYCVPTFITGTCDTVGRAFGSARRAYVKGADLQRQPSAGDRESRSGGSTDDDETYDADEEVAEDDEVRPGDELDRHTVTRSSRRVRTPSTGGQSSRGQSDPGSQSTGRGYERPRHVSVGEGSDEWHGYDDDRNEWREIRPSSYTTANDKYLHRPMTQQWGPIGYSRHSMDAEKRSSVYERDNDSSYYSDPERKVSWIPPPPDD